jgi:hypothetical protein
VQRQQKRKTEPNIYRYEHHHFAGWTVRVDRGGRRWVRYFSDKPGGPVAALKRAREHRRQLVERLPWPCKVKTKYERNRTGTIGVARTRERTRSGTWLIRYSATWPLREGGSKKASFSVALYGEAEARRLATDARRRGLEQLLRPLKPGRSIAALGPSRPRRR